MELCQNEMILFQIFFIIVKILHVLEKLFVFNLEMEIPYRMKFFLKGCYWRKKQVFDQWK